jgi:peptidoglycan hydrolase-like protein with peptidoglycan-binding domain
VPRRRTRRPVSRTSTLAPLLPRIRRGGHSHQPPEQAAAGAPPPRPVVRLSPGPLGLLLAAIVLVSGSGAVDVVHQAVTGTDRTLRTASPLPTPVPPVRLPAGIEALSPYLEQDSCRPVAMPGAVELGDLLRATYPGTSYGIARACGSDGIASEHYEGRAVDWFTSVRDPAGAARAKALLDWMLAADAAGRPDANARRLGVMYLIWNNRIWGSYRAAEGWRPYSTCAAHPERSRDTACHRDHVHISLGWAGAAGRTSFWTGRVAAVDYGPCRAVGFNWAAPYVGLRSSPCPAHARAYPPRGAPAVAGGLYAASGARLGPGFTGPLVVSLQRALGVQADGSFGPLTAAAVSGFRTAHRLAAGEVVDDPTWRALLAAFSGGRTPPRPAPRPSPSPAPGPTATAPGATGGAGGASTGPLAPYVSLVLTYGSSGPAVKAVQRLLGVTQTGWYGPVTTAEVKSFQKAHGIPATGNVGPLTWAALAPLATGGSW